MNYESTVFINSVVQPGVTFHVARVSFGRRLQLMRKIRDLAAQLEFAGAGPKETDKMEAAILSAEIDQTYLLWGLMTIEGLTIDGESATAETFLSRGPENLVSEALAAVQSECSLTEKERKN